MPEPDLQPKPEPRPRPDPRTWGVLPGYVATDGSRRHASARTLDAVLAALGAEGGHPDASDDGPLIIVSGSRPSQPLNRSQNRL